MDTYLDSGIKNIITQFPAIESILEEYEIGCGPCAVGTCLLKDIVEIHRMPPEREQELMARIEAVICPGRKIRVPVENKPAEAAKTELNYSPPMKMLVDEHVLIKRWLALIPQVVASLDLESEEGRQIILDGVDMIRSYADKFHHAKEEDILFKYFDETADIFGVIYEDHRQARGYVKEILAALDRRDSQALGQHLTAYGKLLAEHIKKEDEILFPWLDEQLKTSQVGELLARFENADQQIDVDPQKYQTFINRLEKQFAERG